MSVYKAIFFLEKRVEELEQQLLALSEYVATHKHTPASRKKAAAKKKKAE